LKLAAGFQDPVLSFRMLYIIHEFDIKCIDLTGKIDEHSSRIALEQIFHSEVFECLRVVGIIRDPGLEHCGEAEMLKVHTI
jgi:hypothetical protein